MTSDKDYDALPDIIKNLMGSPEIADILKSVRPTSEPAPDKKEQADISLPPDLMDKLPQVISALRDAGIAAPQSTAQKSDDPSSQPQLDINDIESKLPQAMSMLSGIKSKTSTSGSKNRKALLTALKPYMNDRKRSAIDTMLSVDSMTEIMLMMMGGEK
ncbi:MAG: hypothetical protein J6K92_05435 [Oscillospiraceae bacterium]|nr:hypothetical protein [Oscillospiraceae bacterium]